MNKNKQKSKNIGTDKENSRKYKENPRKNSRTRKINHQNVATGKLPLFFACGEVCLQSA